MNDINPVENEVLTTSSFNNVETKISWELYQKLKYLGIIHEGVGDIDVRSYNIGNSNYSKHLIQPWSIWLDYPELTSWDHDIIKRILRIKQDEPRIQDYDKIIHICKERIRQLNYENRNNKSNIMD